MLFKSKFLATFLVISILFAFPVNVEGKILPQSKKGITNKTGVKSAGTTIGVYPKLRSDRKALIVNFSNFQNAQAVSYMLVYKTNGQDEAAMGALNLTGKATTTSELLFGTCSRNVCRYHPNIKDAKLEISYTSKNGKKYLKKYKIKV